MPSADYPQETYSEYLLSVEHLISQLDKDGPLLIVGDMHISGAEMKMDLHRPQTTEDASGMIFCHLIT